MYDFATAPFWISLYMRNFFPFFISVQSFQLRVVDEHTFQCTIVEHFVTVVEDKGGGDSLV